MIRTTGKVLRVLGTLCDEGSGRYRMEAVQLRRSESKIFLEATDGRIAARLTLAVPAEPDEAVTKAFISRHVTERLRDDDQVEVSLATGASGDVQRTTLVVPAVRLAVIIDAAGSFPDFDGLFPMPNRKVALGHVVGFPCAIGKMFKVYDDLTLERHFDEEGEEYDVRGTSRKPPTIHFGSGIEPLYLIAETTHGLLEIAAMPAKQN